MSHRSTRLTTLNCHSFRTCRDEIRQVIAELSLELQQAREELAAAGNVTRLPARPRTGGL